MSDRKFRPGRYLKQPGIYLDFDNSKYSNSFMVLDGKKETGIVVCDSGDSSVPNGNKRVVTFMGKEYPLLRDAIFAYEDSLPAAQTSA